MPTINQLIKRSRIKSRGAVTFEQAVGNVITGLDAEIAQQPDQQSRTGCSIDVVIAVDGDLFTGDDRLRQTIGRDVHVAESRRIGQKVAQGRHAMPLDVVESNAARQQQLADNVVSQLLLCTKLHIAAAPMPGATGQRSRDAEYVGKGLRCHGARNTAGRRQVEAVRIDNRQARAKVRAWLPHRF